MLLCPLRAMPANILRGGLFIATLTSWEARCGNANVLLLTPLIEAGKLQEARDASRVVVDGVPLGHSGYFSVPSASGLNTNQLFAWFQPCLDTCDPGVAPFIQWFNGGPGSPDTVGAMNQVGNWYVDRSLKLRERCFSWCRTSNCFFVDSPTMTGFSFQVNRSGRYDAQNIEFTATSQDAARQVLGVLLQFFRAWPEYASAPYYVHGLSYGGHYVPWMAQVVLDHNKGGEKQVDIRGIAAGDPCMDNKYQFPTYASTLYAMGLVMEDERAVVEAVMANASRLNDVDCVLAFTEWNKLWNDDGGSSCEPDCEFLFKAFTGSSNTEHLLLGAQPESMNYFRKFLAERAAEFHAEGHPNDNSSLAEGGQVYIEMVRSGDFCAPTAPMYTRFFLEENLDVLVYSANLDPLLGPPSTAAGIQAAWDHAEISIHAGAEAKQAYYAKRKSIWRVEEADVEPAGYSRCIERGSARFCYVVVRNAGHEATSYAPRAAFDLNERFIGRKPFDDVTRSARLPSCAACGGSPPLAGSALPACGAPSREAGNEAIEASKTFIEIFS